MNKSIFMIFICSPNGRFFVPRYFVSYSEAQKYILKYMKSGSDDSVYKIAEIFPYVPGRPVPEEVRPYIEQDFESWQRSNGLPLCDEP